MEAFQQLALPSAGGREFTQQLAMYNAAGIMPEEIQNPYSDYSVAELRRSLFQESLANTRANAGALFSAAVRGQFMDAFGIGRGTLNANVAHKTLGSRMMTAGADYASDIGSYLYTGKAAGKRPSSASAAMGWFVPLQMKNQTAGAFGNVRWGENSRSSIGGIQRGAASIARGASRIRNSRLGGSMKAGFKSFLGWNFMLGNPEDMSLGDMAISYAKHVGLSYGIETISNRFLRRPGALIGHISTFFKDDPIEKILGKDGLIQDFEGSGFSDSLKNRVSRYRNAKDLRPQQKKALYSKIRKQLQKESDRINLSSDGKLYQNVLGRYKGMVSEAKKVTKNAVNNSLDKTGVGRAFRKGLSSISDIADTEVDKLAGVTFRGAAKDTFKTAGRFIRGKATGIDMADSFSVLSSRTMRNAWTIGGAALRVANVASGVIAAGAIVNEGLKYRDKVREEYVRNMMSDRMAFTMMPEVGMSGTERTRAVEAIQNSGMSLRNYLGNEAQMMH
jgi:hypothetical protein